jgi:hypothetical protein
VTVDNAQQFHGRPWNLSVLGRESGNARTICPNRQATASDRPITGQDLRQFVRARRSDRQIRTKCPRRSGDLGRQGPAGCPHRPTPGLLLPLHADRAESGCSSPCVGSRIAAQTSGDRTGFASRTKCPRVRKLGLDGDLVPVRTPQPRPALTASRGPSRVGGFSPCVATSTAADPTGDRTGYQSRTKCPRCPAINCDGTGLGCLALTNPCVARGRDRQSRLGQERRLALECVLAFSRALLGQTRQSINRSLGQFTPIGSSS